MARNGEHDPEVAAFLRGGASSVDMIRGAVRLVVRGFQLTGGGIDSELVQETLSRIFLNLTTGRFCGESSLKTYACKVARYACLEHLRRRRHESDISSRLGISQGAVRLRVHRCRVALRAAAMTQARRPRPAARRTGK